MPSFYLSDWFMIPKTNNNSFVYVFRPKKINCLFPVTVQKKTLIRSWMGDKNFRVGISLNKNLLG